MRHLPKSIKMRAPGFRQEDIRLAAQACGWVGGSRKNLFDMLPADLTIVLDLEDFYVGETLPPNFRIVGLLYATVDDAADRLEPGHPIEFKGVDMFVVGCSTQGLKPIPTIQSLPHSGEQAT